MGAILDRFRAKRDCVKMCKADLNGLGKDLVNGCKKSCKTGDRPESGCDYLENYHTGGDQWTVSYMAMDCDPDSGHASDLLDKRDKEKEDAKNKAEALQKQIMQYTMAGGSAMVLVVILYLTLKE